MRSGIKCIVVLALLGGFVTPPVHAQKGMGDSTDIARQAVKPEVVAGCCVPEKYKPYSIIVGNNDFTRPVPDGSGGYEYEKTYVPMVIVHPHVALRWGKGFRGMTDGVDKDANPFLFDRIYLKDGIASWVSTTVQPNPAPPELLDATATQILEDTLRDIAVKCSHSEDAVRNMNLDTLKKVVDSSCAAQYIP